MTNEDHDEPDMLDRDDGYRAEARLMLGSMFRERLPATAEAFFDVTIELSITETILVNAVALNLKAADQEWGPAIGLSNA